MKTVKTHLPTEQKYLLGISGGVDSMTLLHCCLQENLNIVVCHVNHGLREDASIDETLVRDICQKENIPFYSDHPNVRDYCSQEKVSIELGARHLRKDFFQKVMAETQCNWIVLAHTANDKIETTIHNFFRGSGVNGLASIQEINQEEKILRPFLKYKKNDLIAYAQENSLLWHEDSSNSENDYDRNHIRNVILPEMQSRRSGIENVLLRQADYFKKIEDFLTFSAKDWIEKNISNDSFHKKEFLNLPDILQGEILKILWNTLYKNGFESRHATEIIRWMTYAQGNSQTYFGKTHHLFMKKSIVSLVNKN